MLSKLLFILCLPLSLYALPGYWEPWGKDADLKVTPQELTPTAPKKNSLAARMGEGIILFYQKVISPANGPRSHFRPTSSRYMLLAIRKYGFLKGYSMGCDRLLRENEDPWVYRTIEIDGTLYKWDPP
jgi:putative component of membrane protein insertase Oxa1/YidC/SpoIIIJ protein YidD